MSWTRHHKSIKKPSEVVTGCPHTTDVTLSYFGYAIMFLLYVCHVVIFILSDPFCHRILHLHRYQKNVYEYVLRRYIIKSEFYNNLNTLLISIHTLSKVLVRVHNIRKISIQIFRQYRVHTLLVVAWPNNSRGLLIQIVTLKMSILYLDGAD